MSHTITLIVAIFAAIVLLPVIIFGNIAALRVAWNNVSETRELWHDGHRIDAVWNAYLMLVIVSFTISVDTVLGIAATYAISNL